MKQFINLSKNIIRSNFSDKILPFKLTYAITYRCNSRCTICNIWKRTKFDEISVQEAEQFFSKNNFFNWIDITGGEVFLKPGLLEIIKIIISTQKNLYLLHIPTNGILPGKITKDVTSILAMNPNKFIMTFSIDGPPALHDKLRGIKDNFKSAVTSYKGVRKFRSSKFDCFFGMTLSGYNFREIEATYQALKKEIPELSRNDLHFNIAHHSYHYYGNTQKTLGNTSEIGKELANFNKSKSMKLNGVSLLESIFQGLVPQYLDTHKTPIPCKALTSSLFLNPNGTMYPCSMWSFPLGNIRDISFDLAIFWKSPLAVKTRHVIDMKKCPNCWTPCEAYQSILGNLKQVISNSLPHQ